jgi:hypothetical protein
MSAAQMNLDIFGEFLIRHFRDSILDEVEAIIAGQSMILNGYEMTQKLGKLEEEDLYVIREAITKSVDSALSYLLWELNKLSVDKPLSNLKILVNDMNIRELGPFLQGEFDSDGGWVERFSKYPSPQYDSQLADETSDKPYVLDFQI